MPTLLSTGSNSKSVQSPSKPVSAGTASLSNGDRLIQMLKSLYQADQQVKFLHLQAEADYLLQELQTLKVQKQSPQNQASDPRALQ